MSVDPAESLPDAGFDVVRRGYDLGQVDTHLRRIDAEIAILAADRNAAVDQATQLARELDDARARAEKLRGQVRTLAGPPQSVQGMSERMRSMLRLAEDEVSDMLGRAETDAAQRRQQADQHAAQLLAAAQEESAQTLAAAREEAASYLGPAQMEATELAERTMRERAQLTTDRAAMERRLAEDRASMERETAAQADATRTQLDGVQAASEQRLADERASHKRALVEERASVQQALDAQRVIVERDIAEATRAAEAELTRRWTESEQRRALVEEDFTIAMDQRRSEALAGLGAERATAVREIAGLRTTHAERVRQELAWAENERHRIIADAERRVGELSELRGRIADQLAGARSALGRAIGSLEPMAGEAGARANGHAHGYSNTGPTDDSPTIRTEPATLTDLDPHDVPQTPTPQTPTPQTPTPQRPAPQRPTPQQRTRASAARN